jgi:hypothetical protein
LEAHDLPGFQTLHTHIYSYVNSLVQMCNLDQKALKDVVDLLEMDLG